MPTTLDLCEKYFDTRDIYELLEITKDSLPKDIKKAYYKLSLKVHPDRVQENEKELATEKFKILAKIHSVLTDTDKKALYDEQGIIDDEDDDGKLSSWIELWRKIFKPITTEDIDNFKKDYIGSLIERRDIKKAYLNGKGCINFMMESVPFMSVEDEPRIDKIVREMIAENEVPEYELFTNEPKNKKARRHKKYAKEEKLANKIKSDSLLEEKIMARNVERRGDFENMLDNLMEKYCNKEKVNKNLKKKNENKSQAKKSVRNGRVTKRK